MWLVITILTNHAAKKKSHKKAITMLCRNIGLTIITVACINFITLF